jgi:hypothetical protein
LKTEEQEEGDKQNRDKASTDEKQNSDGTDIEKALSQSA